MDLPCEPERSGDSSATTCRQLLCGLFAWLEPIADAPADVKKVLESWST